MLTITLSEGARDLLKRNMSGPQILVDDKNREAYREPARGGSPYPVHRRTSG